MTALALETPVRLTYAQWVVRLSDLTKDRAYLGTRLGPDVADYLAWAKIQVAPATLESYERDLARLCLLVDKPLGELDEDDIVLVLSTHNRPSVRRAKTPLKGFCKWAYRKGRLGKDIADLIPALRSDPPRVYDIFSPGEQAALIAAASAAPLPVVERVRLLLLLETGARKGEVLGLRVQDVNLSDRVVVLRGKGRKERVVPIRGDVVRAVEEHLLTPVVELEPRPQDFFWFRIYVTGAYRKRVETVTKATPEQPMSSAGFQWWWGRAVERSGIAYRKPHMTRHTYATDALDATGDLYAVKDLLGHASTKATEVYIHSQRHRLDRAVEQLARLRKVQSTD